MSIFRWPFKRGESEARQQEKAATEADDFRANSLVQQTLDAVDEGLRTKREVRETVARVVDQLGEYSHSR